MQDVEVQPNDYAAVLAANVRRARAGAGLTQTSLAKRMRQLGCKWHFQTVGAVERGDRPVSAYELPALAMSTGITPEVLMLPPSSDTAVTFNGHVVPSQRLSIIDDSVTWDGDELKVTRPSVVYRPAEIRQAVDVMREELLGRQAADDSHDDHGT